MHKAFRAGDLGHRDGGGKGVATGDAAGDFELMGAEPDAIWAIAQLRIEPGRRRFDTTGILHGAVLLLDADDVERRIGKHLRDAQRVGLTIDL